MNESVLSITESKRIARAVDIVRLHFADVEYHARNPVHAGVTFTLIGTDQESCRYRLETRIGRLKLGDELVLRQESDGTLVHQVVAGLNAGGRSIVRFVAEGTDLTRTEFTAEFRLVGLKRLLRPFCPLLGVVLRRMLAKALEEDRLDLEQGDYVPSPSAYRLVGGVGGQWH